MDEVRAVPAPALRRGTVHRGAHARVGHQRPGHRWLAGDAIDLLARAATSGVFLWAGVTKALDRQGFTLAVHGYRVLPDALVRPIAIGLPWLEVALGAFLLTGLFVRFAGGGVAALIVVFIVAMAQAKARGLQIDCGCFGGNGVGAGVTWFDMVRDLPLLAAGVFLAWRRDGPLRLDRWFAERD